MEKKSAPKKYYLGVDIGTDSVGYASTKEDYTLCKYKGEPVWGVVTFDAAEDSADRRAFRTARRRIDRRQQRVSLINDLFAKEITSIDPQFFIRRKESALFAEDRSSAMRLFEGVGISDEEYHKTYPTIHHLICELMENDQPHDVRLVYIACAWLVAHRGHFLFDVAPENVGILMDFNALYGSFCTYLHDELDSSLPWPENTAADEILEIMQMQAGVRKKTEAFKANVFGGKKIAKEPTEDFPYSCEAIVKLLSGGRLKPAELFCNASYAETESISLQMSDEDFESRIVELGDDGELLRKLRGLQDCALLISTMSYAGDQGKKSISASKVAVYDQHRRDLKWLKYSVKKYLRKDYDAIFRDPGKENYVAYSYNVKSCRGNMPYPKASREDLSDYLYKKVKDIPVEEKDREQYEDMLARLEVKTYLPKQTVTDNRVIPQQLYRYELSELLNHAEKYLPFLSEEDETGLSTKRKLLSIFDFRIPYYVGPLRKDNGDHAWIVRKADGRIFPWNFEEKVDLDASEQEFIRRMTNTCTYLPGEDVLPYHSLLYSRFMVLNEINNLKVNDRSIPVEVKQAIYNDLFMSPGKVNLNSIRNYLRNRGLLMADDIVGGVDTTIKASLNSFHVFRRMLENGILTEDQVEAIINHAAYSEDRPRLLRWLTAEYPHLTEDDKKYIARQNLKGFGRLSSKLLTGVYGTEKARQTGEAFTIMDALWQTNQNLMQLLSDRFTFSESISAMAEEYYAALPHRSLSDRLSEMYISNAVKRPIIRTLEIAKDVEKAMGGAPAKIFVEMARGGTPAQRGKRTVSRKQQLVDLYKQVKTEDSRILLEELEAMGDAADNRLQSEKLFLYYLQLGKCLYTGNRINLAQIADGTYNIDHIFPKSYVKDDSILNNKILVDSTVNGAKKDVYPVPREIRSKMQGFWQMLNHANLMTDEKYRRLTRSHPFTDEEKMDFINRQLVETRQSTKVVARLLQERYPDAEIVYVKAGMVSEFRQEFSMLKCRSVNDYHHAKDAYLNIVVGNVYHERFTKKWFSLNSSYNVQVEKIFAEPLRHGDSLIWNGEADIAKVRKIMQKNAVHLTQYAFCRHSGQNGGFFDQQPKKAKEGLIPRKKGLPTEKYGGYQGTTTTFFVLVKLENKKKSELMFFPVDLLFSENFLNDPDFKYSYTEQTLREYGKKFDALSFPMGDRILKINTMLSLDGFRACIASGSLKDGRMGLLPMTQLAADYQTQLYIKRLEMFEKKKSENRNYQYSAQFDRITKEENEALYDFLASKIDDTILSKRPKAPTTVLEAKRERFVALDVELQVHVLMQIILLLSRQTGGVDLSLIGESKTCAKPRMSLTINSWKKEYDEIRIIDSSASGLHEVCSCNLFDLV